MKPRVVLFYPRTGWDTEGVTISLPLSVLYVAAPLVADGLDVVLLDDRLLKDSQAALEEALRGGRDVLALGISSMTGVQIAHGLKASRIARGVAPKVPIVWGGVHPTLLPEQTLAHPLVDHVVVGEGEDTFRELLRRLRGKQSVEDIPGLGSKGADGSPRVNPEGPAVDLDAQPPLPYGLVDMRRYITSKILGERDLTIMASRGCHHQCAYCYQCNPNVNNKWRAYTPSRVVDLIQELSEDYGVNAIMIQDDLFFGRKAWVEQVCTEILRRDLRLSFRADCRIDYINAFSDDFLALVRRAGLKSLYLGVESGSDRILKMIHKNITAEDVRRAVARLRNHDIVPQLSFMGGFPSETMQDIHQTLSLMLEVVRIHPKARTSNLQLYTPYPGTELWEAAVALGIPEPKSLEEWASSSWNRSGAVWLSPGQRDFLELASYFSYFIDGKTVASWYGGSLPLRLLASLYTRMVRFRVRHSFYRCIVVGRIIRWLKEKGIL